MSMKTALSKLNLLSGENYITFNTRHFETNVTPVTDIQTTSYCNCQHEKLKQNNTMTRKTVPVT